jgi:hypothetical protein
MGQTGYAGTGMFPACNVIVKSMFPTGRCGLVLGTAAAPEKEKEKEKEKDAGGGID